MSALAQIMTILLFSIFVLVLLAQISLWAIKSRYPAIGIFIQLKGWRAHVLRHTPDCRANNPVDFPRARLLLLHGAASNGREWPAAMGDLIEAYDWAAPDRPGFAYSSPFDGHESLAKSALAQAELIEALWPDVKEGGPEPILLCHSWGSAIGLKLAIDRPDLVGGLVLVAPASHPWGGPPANIHQLTLTPIIGPILTRTIVPIFGLLAMNKGIARAFDPGPIHPKSYADMIGVPLYFRHGAFTRNAREMVVADGQLAIQAKDYGQIACPVFVMSGGGDKIVYNHLHAKSLKAELPKVQTHREEGGGHMPHWKNPAQVIAAIDWILAHQQ